MSLRLKLVLALVSLTAAATVTIGALSYVGISNRLESEVDRSLDEAAQEISAPGRSYESLEASGTSPSR